VALEPPSVRFARWMIVAMGLALASVLSLGVRGDAGSQMMDGWFLARAIVTLIIVFAAAIVAFSTSVPGAEIPNLGRALPLAASLMWAVMLVGTIAATWSSGELLAHLAPHPSCVLIIAATALSPEVLLLRMLQRAAPLQATRTAGYAGLASLALGALAAQFVCANDAATHHLLWHYLPVVLLTVVSIIIGSTLLARGADDFDCSPGLSRRER
jgi:hypothetical protein